MVAVKPSQEDHSFFFCFFGKQIDNLQKKTERAFTSKILENMKQEHYLSEMDTNNYVIETLAEKKVRNETM